MRRTKILCAAILFATAGQVQAAVIISFVEMPGGGVTVSGNGSVSTTSGLTLLAAGPFNIGVNLYEGGNQSRLYSSTGDYSTYQPTSGFSSVSVAGTTASLAGDPMASFGFNNSGQLFLPFVPTAPISFSVPNPSATLATWGLIDGDSWGATWSTGTGTESIQFSASVTTPPTIPEPSTFALSLLGLMSLGMIGRRRNR